MQKAAEDDVTFVFSCQVNTCSMQDILQQHLGPDGQQVAASTGRCVSPLQSNNVADLVHGPKTNWATKQITGQWCCRLLA